jgi:UDP-glucose 4-epimerase
VNYHGKISEESPVHPKTYYGIAKYTAECLLEKICTNLQIHLTILRPPLIYGRDDLSRGYGPTGFTYKAENNEEIHLWGAGKEFREFIYVDDIGRTVKRLINNDYCGLLNLVSGKSHTYKEIVYLLHKIMGSNIKVISHQRTKEKVDHHFSNRLIHNVLGDFEFTSLKDGLRKMHRSIIN